MTELRLEKARKFGTGAISVERQLLDKNCSFGQNVYVANDVTIGDCVKVQNNVSIYDSVIIEDDVFCGPSMVFTNVINPRATIERKNEYKQTLVRRGSSIGANATIVCGVEIGEYSFIAAGAVVTKKTLNLSPWWPEYLQKELAG